jgi:hypothetical protein
MRNKVILKEVAEAARQAEAKQMRSALFEDCRSLLSELEGDVSGYAIVAWSPQGELRTAFYAGKGPIRPAIIPVLAQDALSRHVAQHMAAPIRLGESE